MKKIEIIATIDLDDIPNGEIFKESIERLALLKKSYSQMAKKMDITKRPSYLDYLAYIKEFKKVTSELF